MAKYVYPAIFTPEDDGSYSIVFPDLEGCYTCGDNLEDSIEMAEDALALVLYGYEKDGREIPAPSARSAFSVSGNDFVNFIACHQKSTNSINLRHVTSHFLRVGTDLLHITQFPIRFHSRD